MKRYKKWKLKGITQRQKNYMSQVLDGSTQLIKEGIIWKQ